MAVRAVKGKAFFIKIFSPSLKFSLFSSNIKVILCLIECRKQKYNVKAISGEK